jgi:c-di-GMP-binding flagellar brake protein YcgR
MLWLSAMHSLTPTSTAERRETDRRPFRTAIMVQAPGCAAVQLRTFDLSPGGVGIVSPGHAKTGLRVAVSFNLPVKGGGQRPVKAEAEVMYTVFSSSDDGIRIGARFVSLDAAAQQAISDFLANR